MKIPAKKIRVVSIAILCGGLCVWATRLGTVWGFREKDALCVLELQGGESSASATFTTSETIERFFVAARPGASNEGLSLSITGRDVTFFRGRITQSTRFSCGRDVAPGTYTVALRQEAGNHGGLVVIAENQVGFTGWQVWSRALLGLVAVSGTWAWGARKSRNVKYRVVSAYTFQTMLLALALIFVYLLFHEGGHALGSTLFGRYDFARSDFWGIHGNPHSGIRSGVPIEPWQRAIESFGGPMFPTLMGWALFLVWGSRGGKQLRAGRPMVDLYSSAIVAMSVFPFLAIAGCLLGIISDSDWRVFIENVPGPLWLVKTLLWAVLLVNAIILWRVLPELRRTWKANAADARNLFTDREAVP